MFYYYGKTMEFAIKVLIDLFWFFAEINEAQMPRGSCKSIICIIKNKNINGEPSSIQLFYFI